MRRAYSKRAIESGAECRAVALATTQHRVDEPGGTRLLQQTCRIDRLVDGGVRRDFGIDELAHPDDAQGTNLGTQRLLRFAEQLSQQCIETHIPADAVVTQ